MKKLTSLLLVIAIVFTFAVTPVSAVESGDDANQGLPGTDAESLHIINTVDPYVRKSGSILIMTLPIAIRQQLGTAVVSAIQNGLNEINTAVASGTLALTDSGTIYDPNDDELVVQGGNVNKVTWHWWGVRRYASKSYATRLSTSISDGSDVLGGVAGAAALFVGTGPLAIGVSLFSLFNSVKFNLLSNEINYYNALTNRGVIIDLRWVVTFKVSSQ